MCPDLAYLMDHSSSKMKKELCWQILRSCGLKLLSHPFYWQVPLCPLGLLAWPLVIPHCLPLQLVNLIGASWVSKFWPYRTSLLLLSWNSYTPERSLFQSGSPFPMDSCSDSPSQERSCLMGIFNITRSLLGNEGEVYKGNKGGFGPCNHPELKLHDFKTIEKCNSYLMKRALRMLFVVVKG